MTSEGPRLLTYWAKRCGIAPNTLRTWSELPERPLPTQISSSHKIIAEIEFRSWLDANRHFPAVGRALERLDRVTPEAARTTGKFGDPDPPTAAPASDDRDEVRAFRARIATLDDQLDKERKQSELLRIDRDRWRAAARAHRQSLRAQLDLEDARDMDIAGPD